MIASIITEFDSLPYPIPRNSDSEANIYRRTLDTLFARVILENSEQQYSESDVTSLVQLVQSELFEWLGWAE